MSRHYSTYSRCSNPSFISLLLVGALRFYFPTHYYLLSVAQALSGAFLAVSGWATLHVVFGLYASNASQYDAYGVVNGAVLNRGTASGWGVLTPRTSG